MWDDELEIGDFSRFGQLLHHRRDVELGLSMRELAARSGVNPGSISWAERGDRERRPSLATVRKLDHALDAHGVLIRAFKRVLGEPIDPAEPDIIDLLPPIPRPFVGRDQLVPTITSALDEHDEGPTAVVLSGPGGIGKSSVALMAAHTVKSHYAAALAANLRGWDQASGPRPVESVLRSWCRALGVPDAALAGDQDELIETWRRVSARRPVLAVADNALSWQVEPLRPTHPEATLIVTTRDRALQVDAALHLEVPPLDETEAVALLAARTGWASRVVVPLVAPCAGSPLALCSAAAQAAAHWDQETLGTMAAEFNVNDEPDLEDRIARSNYECLEEDTQRAWRLWALIGGPLGEDQAAAVLGVDSRTARRHLHACVRYFLLQRDGGYVFADTYRDFAIREAHRVDSEQERSTALRRGLTWLLHGHVNAAPLLAGRDDTPVQPVPLEDGVTAPEHAEYADAWAWTETHWNYPQTVTSALALGENRLAWQLVAAGISAAYLIKPLNDWDRAARRVLDVLRPDQDPAGLAWMHQARGIAAGDTGNAQRAFDHFVRALELRRTLDSDHLRDVGWSALNAARWAVATDAADDQIEPLIAEGLAAHAAIDHPGGPTLGMALRATLAARRGDWPSARDRLATAWDAAPRLGDPAISSFVGASFADALLRTGEPDSAAEVAQATDKLAEAAGVDWGRIGALIALSRAEPSAAREHLLVALALADRIDDDRAELIRDTLADTQQ